MSYVKELLDASYTQVDVDNWWAELIDPDEELGSDWKTAEDIKNFDPIKVSKSIPWGDSHITDIIADKFRDLVEYSPDQNCWYVWDGRVHFPVHHDLVAEEVSDRFYRHYEKALDFVQTWIETESEKYAREGKPDSKKRQEVLKKVWEKTYAEHKRLRNRLRGYDGRRTLAKDLKQKVSIPSDRYEDDTKWFVVRDGVFDCDSIRAGEKPVLLEHSPKRPVSRWFDANYADLVNNGHWDGFLESSIPDDEVREYVQVALGAAFSGNVKLRSYLIFLGEPSSGKSLFLETLATLGSSGSGYVVGNAASDALIEQNNGKNFSRASFGNRRVIGVSEPDSTRKLDGDFIKEFTGDKQVTFEAKYGQPTPSIAQGLIIIATNEMPRLDFSDQALVNRTKPIPFPYSFVPKPVRVNDRQRDSLLGDKLLEDRSAVLHWILEGMQKFYTEYESLEDSAPSAVVKEIRSYSEDRQTPLRWMEEVLAKGGLHFEMDPEHLAEVGTTYEHMSLAEATESYRAWCSARAEDFPYGKLKFRDMILKEYGMNEYPDMVKVGGQMRFPTLLKTNSFRAVTELFIRESGK